MISLAAAGGYDALAYKPLDATETTRGANIKPEHEDFLVTVQTHGCGVNYAEVCIRWGIYKSATEMVGYPITPGFEFSGTVTSVGGKVTKFHAGDVVFGLTLFGGYSERVAVPESQLFPLPQGLTLSQAAAFPCVALTAWYAICECCKIRPGYPVLIHSVAGGVGSMLAQIAKALGCFVVGVVGKSHKVEFALKELGCDAVIDKSSTKLWTEAEKHSPSGYKAIFDANGVETLANGYAHLASGGRLITYGFHTMLPKSTADGTGKVGISGTMKMGWNYMKTPSFSPLDMCSANKGVVGFNLSFMFGEVELLADAMNQLLGWVADGKLKVAKVTEFALKDVGEAHRALESGTTVGKLVLISGKKEMAPLEVSEKEDASHEKE